jgi:hypothetical protein
LLYRRSIVALSYLDLDVCLDVCLDVYLGWLCARPALPKAATQMADAPPAMLAAYTTLRLSAPAKHVLRVELNRPDALNAMNARCVAVFVAVCVAFPSFWPFWPLSLLGLTRMPPPTGSGPSAAPASAPSQRTATSAPSSSPAPASTSPQASTVSPSTPPAAPRVPRFPRVPGSAHEKGKKKPTTVADNPISAEWQEETDIGRRAYKMRDGIMVRLLLSPSLFFFACMGERKC